MPVSAMKQPTVLWWSRGDREYSRDRIVRNAFRALGWHINDFCPVVSQLAHVEAAIRCVPIPDVVWVPCFRQRDVAAARIWSQQRGVPLIFDPLISAWDKQVFERNKFAADSSKSRRLLAWESDLFCNSDVVIADTNCHAEFFQQAHGQDRTKLGVIPVSAEEEIFVPQPPRTSSNPVRVLFYGSFIGLQGPQYIAEAARAMPDVDWTFIGSGPLLVDCQQIVEGCRNVEFIPRVPYTELPTRIGEADILMGVFGTTEKAGRVIPNKVYQALACGRPVVTQVSNAYPAGLMTQTPAESGIVGIAPGDPSQIIDAVTKLANAATELTTLSIAARQTYDRWFSNRMVEQQLVAALSMIQAGSHITRAA